MATSYRFKSGQRHHQAEPGRNSRSGFSFFFCLAARAYSRYPIRISIPRRRGRHIVRDGVFFFKASAASHSLSRSFFPTATSCAGLAAGFRITTLGIFFSRIHPHSLHVVLWAWRAFYRESDSFLHEQEGLRVAACCESARICWVSGEVCREVFVFIIIKKRSYRGHPDPLLQRSCLWRSSHLSLQLWDHFWGFTTTKRENRTEKPLSRSFYNK